MEKMRKLRADIADNDSAERFTKKFGVDMYFGRARFISRREVDIDGTTVRFIKSVVATGGSPRLPAIDGLQEAYEKQNWSNPVILTNLTIFNLTSLPESIGIIGTFVVITHIFLSCFCVFINISNCIKFKTDTLSMHKHIVVTAKFFFFLYIFFFGLFQMHSDIVSMLHFTDNIGHKGAGPIGCELAQAFARWVDCISDLKTSLC